jgi:hypothetical protein
MPVSATPAIIEVLRTGGTVCLEAAATIRQLQSENAMLRVLLCAMAERIAAQSEVLSRRVERRTGEAAA